MRFNCANLPGHVWQGGNSTLVLISPVISPGLPVAQRPVLFCTSPPPIQRSVICTGRQSCLQEPMNHFAGCLCKAEWQKSSPLWGALDLWPAHLIVQLWGPFHRHHKVDGRIDGKAPATWQKAACQTALTEGFNSTRNFLLPFFLEEYFHCTTLSALVLSGVSAHEKLAWPGPCFLNLQIIGISKWVRKDLLTSRSFKGQWKIFLCIYV